MLGISAVFFLIYLSLKLNGIHYKNYQGYAIPIMQLIIFFILSKIYKSFFGKNPEDTFWTMDTKLMKDGIFNFLFGGIFPIIHLDNFSKVSGLAFLPSIGY